MARNRAKTKKSKKVGSKRRSKSPSTGGTRPRRHPKRGRISSTPELEKALRFLRAGNSQRLAAKSAGVSVKRFREFIRGNKLAKFGSRRWVFTDKRRRQVVAITTRGEKQLVLLGFEPASWATSHRNAFKQFVETADVSLLEPFKGVSITDERGRRYLLETRPNVLFRLAAAGGEPYEHVYKLIS
jgi:hypothetical protein